MVQYLHMIRIAVARGGISSEHDVSLKTGESILRALGNHADYKVFDLVQTKEGQWILRGLPIDLKELIHHVDLVWNSFHGEYGEDGKFAQDLELLGIPYVGSEPIPSAVSMNKHSTKCALQNHGFLLSPHLPVSSGGDTMEMVSKIHSHCSPPWIVKPTTGGSSVGTRVAKTIIELQNFIEEHNQNNEDVIVEQFVYGKEASVFVAEGYRGEDLYAFPPIEIVVPDNRFFDLEMKYSGQASEIVPGRFSEEEKNMLKTLAIQAHRLLGLRHFSRSDFIVTKRGIYYLETNTIPGMTEESLAPKAIKSVGGTLKDFVKHIVDLALHKKADR
jgi:D-alanine-D-alanine ligase